MIKNGITAITPTGNRHLAFTLCQEWMKNQTMQPDQWIVVDDGTMPLKPMGPMQYVRREPREDDPKHTLVLNLKTAVPFIRGKKILIIEDDEYYAPEYIEEMARQLDEHEVIGIGNTKYYHLDSGKYFRHGNYKRASLAQTAFRRSFLPEFKRLLKITEVYIDIQIWKSIEKSGRGAIFVDNNKSLYVGIKGLAGREGIGQGHIVNHPIYRKHPSDPSRNILKKWIPRDYDIYLDIINKKRIDWNRKRHVEETMKVAIIIPTYNRLESLKRTVHSISAGYHSNIHIIIVIDGNNEMRPVFPAPFVTVLRNEKRMDWIFSINRILKETKDADAVIYASDDLNFPQDAISKAVTAMRTHFPDSDGVISLRQNCPGVDSAFGLMGRKFIDRFPDCQVFCPDYTHYVSDVELGKFAKSINKFRFCEDVILEHDRPTDKTRELGLTVLTADRATQNERIKKSLLWGKTFERVRK